MRRGGAGRRRWRPCGPNWPTRRWRWWWPTTATGCSSWPRSTCPSSRRCSPRPAWPSTPWAAWSTGLEGRLGDAEQQLQGRAQPAPAGLRADRRGPAGRGRVGSTAGANGAVDRHDRTGRPASRPTDGDDAPGERVRGPDGRRGADRRPGVVRPGRRRHHRQLPGPELHRPLHRPGRAPGQPGRVRRAHHPLRAAAGLGALAVTFALTADRLVSWLTYPVAGRLSDRTQSRVGRRTPYMAGSLIVMGVGHLDVHRGQRVLAPGPDDRHRRPGVGHLHPHQRGRRARGVRPEPMDQGPPAHHRARHAWPAWPSRGR